MKLYEDVVDDGELCIIREAEVNAFGALMLWIYTSHATDLETFRNLLVRTLLGGRAMGK
jgi:hypothetical protein